MLCEFCSGLTLERLLELNVEHRKEPFYFPKDFPAKAYYQHQPSFRALVSSADAGCETCQAFHSEYLNDGLWNLQRSQCTPKPQPQLTASVKVCLAVTDKEVDISEQLYDILLVSVGYYEHAAFGDESYETLILNGEGPFEECIIRFSLTRHRNASPKLKELRLGQAYMGNGLESKETFERACNWLHLCVTQHKDEHCPSLHDKPLPTRVLDLGPLAEGLDPKLFLSSGSRGQYVALSHCWGGDVSTKTTLSSLHEHTKGIPLANLPRTFQDAILITCELGFRYLWIDSICIIQDSEEDWQKESALMNEVFKNAAITIAAAAAKNSKSGILNKFVYRSQNFKTYSSLPLSRHSSPADVVVLSSWKGDEDFWNITRGLPLARRGWTYQERLLSQRVLHYGERGIYFQCRTAHLSGDGNLPLGFDRPHSAVEALLSFSSKLDRPGVAPHQHRLYDKWLLWVENYCQNRHLTYPKDKLPALAGVASEFRAQTHDEYLAGIWRGDLARGLLWYLREPSRRYRARAPSWSWARWDSHFTFSLIGYEPVIDKYMIELVSADVQFSGLNPLGEVKSGRLVLRGWLWYMHHDGFSLRLGTDWVMMDLAEDDEPLKPARYTILLIGTFLSYRGYQIPDVWEKGMLLLKSTGEDEDVFERVGSVFNRGSHVNSWKNHGYMDLTEWTWKEITLV